MKNVLPEIAVLIFACIALLSGAKPTERGVRPPASSFAYYTAQLGVIVAGLLSLALIPQRTVVLFSGQFIVDHMTLGLSFVIYLSVFLCFLYGRHYIEDRGIAQPEYYALALFSLLGMLFLVSSRNLLSLFLSLECMSLPIYVMVAMQREERRCVEAAMKYFVVGALATGLLLFGMSFVFGATGSFDILTIAHQAANLSTSMGPMLVMGLVFLLAGLVFKLGAAPFHMWVPDVYEGAPTSVVLFLSAAPKLAAFALLFRVLAEALPATSLQWHHALVLVAILSMALGNFMAIVQDNLKRLLAYSSIAHMGYAVLAFSTATAYGEEAAVFYLVSYALMALGSFGVLAILSSGTQEADSIADLAGLNNKNPWLAFVMLLIMFSMAGIPPIIGFIAKLRILESLIQVHEVWLAVLALLFAIIGAYYYLRVVKVMYFDNPEDTQAFVYTRSNALAITVNGGLIFLLGVLPAQLFALCHWMLMP